jgi:hypothetical protein
MQTIRLSKTLTSTHNLRFQVLTALSITISGGGSKHIWNVRHLLRDCTSRYPSGLSSSYSPPWEPEVSFGITWNYEAGKWIFQWSLYEGLCSIDWSCLLRCLSSSIPISRHPYLAELSCFVRSFLADDSECRIHAQASGMLWFRHAATARVCLSTANLMYLYARKKALVLSLQIRRLEGGLNFAVLLSFAV